MLFVCKRDSAHVESDHSCVKVIFRVKEVKRLSAVNEGRVYERKSLPYILLLVAVQPSKYLVLILTIFRVLTGTNWCRAVCLTASRRNSQD